MQELLAAEMDEKTVWIMKRVLRLHAATERMKPTKEELPYQQDSVDLVFRSSGRSSPLLQSREHTLAVSVSNDPFLPAVIPVGITGPKLIDHSVSLFCVCGWRIVTRLS